MTCVLRVARPREPADAEDSAVRGHGYQGLHAAHCHGIRRERWVADTLPQEARSLIPRQKDTGQQALAYPQLRPPASEKSLSTPCVTLQCMLTMSAYVCFTHAGLRKMYRFDCMQYNIQLFPDMEPYATDIIADAKELSRYGLTHTHTQIHCCVRIMDKF